ncbi:M15 family metallopeptidase [Streptomyces iakyrus]|uniref:M15 family metallopeptidase n=1 Tax=Streptomyces iakyrus TaxID=68219 RepID=UPI0033A97322
MSSGGRTHARGFGRGLPAVLAAGALLAAGCSADAAAEKDSSRPERSAPPARTETPTPSSTPTPTPTPTPSLDAVVTEITDAQWARMVAAGLWRKECPDVRDQLRRVEMNYLGFDGEVHRGVLVVNQDVTAGVIRVFTRLFEAGFPIRRMVPMEEYDGDLNASLADDNTSAFNCRRAEQINAPFKESPHANGRAIDINPFENPWKDLRTKKWSPSGKYAARTPGKGKILEGGLVWKAFTDEGWIWQDIKVADYMHFDTGYPSEPYKGPDANRTASSSPVPRGSASGGATPAG